MTKKERLEIYENFFHRINVHCITMDQAKISEAVGLINSWSYAHRSGNGENSSHQQKKAVEHVIGKMRDF